jgi:hypothetical protein
MNMKVAKGCRYQRENPGLSGYCCRQETWGPVGCQEGDCSSLTAVRSPGLSWTSACDYIEYWSHLDDSKNSVTSSQRIHRISITETSWLMMFRKTIAVVRTIWNTRIQFVPHRKHIMSPLQRPAGYDRQSVGQSVLVSVTHLGLATSFSFPLKFPLDSCGFVIL